MTELEPMGYWVCEDRPDPRTGKAERYFVRGPVDSEELARELLAAAKQRGWVAQAGYVLAEPTHG